MERPVLADSEPGGPAAGGEGPHPSGHRRGCPRRRLGGGSIQFAASNGPLIEHWDGSAWTVVANPGPSGGRLVSVAALNGHDVWAAGETFGPAGSVDTLFEHWNGTAWKVVAGPANADSGGVDPLAIIAHDDVWAAGAFHQGYVTRTMTAHWDGTAWTSFNAPEIEQAHNSITAVAADPSGNFWAVGQWVVFDPEHVNTLALHNLTP